MGEKKKNLDGIIQIAYTSTGESEIFIALCSNSSIWKKSQSERTKKGEAEWECINEGTGDRQNSSD